MSIFTTAGSILLIFYDQNPFLIVLAWNFLGFCSTMFIVNSIKEQCAVFINRKPLIVSLVNGIFDASAGVFLIFKQSSQTLKNFRKYQKILGNSRKSYKILEFSIVIFSLATLFSSFCTMVLAYHYVQCYACMRHLSALSGSKPCFCLEQPS